MVKFNQKWAMPLDFQNFFVKNIQKIKNVLRPSSPPLRGRASPQGEALTKANSKRNVLRFVYVTAPHSSAVADTFPPRGRLETRLIFNLTSLAGYAATLPEGESKREILPHSEKATSKRNFLQRFLREARNTRLLRREFTYSK